MKKLSERKKQWIERTVANDRSYKLYLYNRFFIFALLVLAQLVGYVFLLYAFAYDSQIGYAIQTAVGVLALIFVLTIINRYDRPSTKLNWILLILLIPIVGVPMYLLYGDGKQTCRMRKKIEKAKRENQAQFLEIYGEGTGFLPQTRGEAVSCYLTSYAGYPIYTDGEISYYKSGEELYPVMLEALQKAEKFILLEYFIIAGGKMWDSILKVLLQKAMQGVQVRIIYDDFGCMMTLPPDYDTYLESLHKNIKCLSFNPVVPVFTLRMNNRDHRKILVVDGKVAFTGGINLADEYVAQKVRFGYWKDSGVKITGNAVRSFTMMFFYLWNAFRKDKEALSAYLLPPSEIKSDTKDEEKQTQIHPYDDSPLDKQSVGATVYLDMIHRARDYVYIFTPYLILDDEMRAALMRAAMRGVDVRIVTPGIPDKKMVYRLTRANYEILMRVGVKIYEYTPGFIHSKSMVCDDECAVVGTINFDYRSLYLHFENAVYFSGCDAVMEVKRDCEETFAVSKLCTKENHKRGFFGRLGDSLLRLFETIF
ncbi:MAG: cardiolipin synthase [Clostridiales bacterium]|nr:cardiolipin synthase [Clostridiales bacterium]